MNNILAPSILSADFGNLERDIKTVEENGAKYLHIDVMDGVFVPSISFGMVVQKSIRRCTNITFDTHLMITEPIRYVEEFASIGSDIITVHLEACENAHDTLKAIRNAGCKAGLSIKPGTDVKELLPYMDEVDMILIMSVEPGFGGQKYMEESTARIREVARMIKTSGHSIDLEVDGGINIDNVKTVLDAGANVIVSGSSLFKNDLGKNVKDYIKILESEKE